MARLSSRKYVQIEEIKDKKLIGLGGRRVPDNYIEKMLALVHAGGVMLVRSILKKDTAYTEFRTAHGGKDFVFTRYHEIPESKKRAVADALKTGITDSEKLGIGFDEGHLKRVADTVWNDVINFDKKQVNLLSGRRSS